MSLNTSTNLLSLVATALITSRPSVTGQGIEKAEPTIEHKYPLLELKASTWPKHLLVTESMQDQEHIDR